MKKIKIFFLKRAICKNISRGLRIHSVKFDDSWDDDKKVSELEEALLLDRLYEIRRENGFMKDIPVYSKNYKEYQLLISTIKQPVI